jgi:hypothetical protein
MVVLLTLVLCGRMTAAYLGAQTERRGGAGPVGGLLGGKEPTGRSFLFGSSS